MTWIRTGLLGVALAAAVSLGNPLAAFARSGGGGHGGGGHVGGGFAGGHMGGGFAASHVSGGFAASHVSRGFASSHMTGGFTGHGLSMGRAPIGTSIAHGGPGHFEGQHGFNHAFDRGFHRNFDHRFQRFDDGLFFGLGGPWWGYGWGVPWWGYGWGIGYAAEYPPYVDYGYSEPPAYSGAPPLAYGGGQPGYVIGPGYDVAAAELAARDAVALEAQALEGFEPHYTQWEFDAQHNRYIARYYFSPRDYNELIYAPSIGAYGYFYSPRLGRYLGIWDYKAKTYQPLDPRTKSWARPVPPPFLIPPDPPTAHEPKPAELPLPPQPLTTTPPKTHPQPPAKAPAPRPR